ncbi:MAG: hypothetical protein WBG08_11955 [Litorimonas sp.]
MKARFLAIAATALIPFAAQAQSQDDKACEIVIVQEVVDNDGGRMTVAAYRPAKTFIAQARKDARSVTLTDEGAPIRGVICTRNDLVPTADDYALLATGVPLSLSQDFDSAGSDILTVYFGDGRFQHRYTSDYPMSGEFEDALTARLDAFSSRDHGLVSPDP